jgi:signal transduction histidine kinase
MSDYLRTGFLRALAHALRSPLGTSQGAIDELAHVAPEQGDPFAGMARRGLDRIARLADQLEWVAEIEAGSIDEPSTPCDLGHLVREAVSTSSVNGVELQCRLPEEALVVKGDPTLLGRTLHIVIDNAVRFARESVTVVLEHDGERETILIDDDGPGIDPERRALLFHRYVSARDRGADSDLALGLSLAKDYVQLHGGSIELSAAPGGGTRCRIELPRTDVDIRAGAR